MPNVRRGVLRRMRGAEVAGINWRPTLFAEEFLHPHACCLCQVIPKNTILLPCSHALCETCERGSQRRNGSGGVCPLCGESFEEDECQPIKLSPKKASSLKAYCWNHAQGCRFVDVLPAVLLHYEQECNYHSTSCLGCGENVLHRDLPRHYKAGCRRRKLPAKWRHVGQGDTGGAAGDCSAAIPEEPKPVVDDAQLSALRSQMNELTRQMRELGQALEKASGTLADVELGLDSELSEALEKLSVVSGESADSGKRVRLTSESSVASSDLASSDAGGHKRAGQGPQVTQAAPADQASREANAKADAKAEVKAEAKIVKKIAMPWALEERHILRKLEIIANQSLHYLESLRQGAARPEAAMTCYELVPLGSNDTVDAKLCPIPRCSRMPRHAVYRFSAKGVDELLKPGVYDLKVAGVGTRWHKRVLFFTVILGSRVSERSLEVFVKWGRTLDVDRQPPQIVKVAFVHREFARNRALERASTLPLDAVFLPGFHLRYKTSFADLKEDNFIQNGELKIELAIGD
ncbi:uncharacterized protein LOC119465880 [Dermacentor silvarum]|uniref:uncharacterized protein LOC119465880 n=1 Tax=Dermacentor silvarum TaxID=543639 RepID=UPI001898948F|nr:uncharacterized protein LOC119465880 [Dermacentor silvarum]